MTDTLLDFPASTDLSWSVEIHGAVLVTFQVTGSHRPAVVAFGQPGIER